MAKNVQPNIEKAKTEYLATNMTLKEVAEKYGINYSTIQRASRLDKWGLQRKKLVKEAEAKRLEFAKEIIKENDEKQIKMALEIGKNILMECKIALEQISIKQLKLKKKTKSVKKYKNGNFIETIEDSEEVVNGNGIVDTLRLMQISNTYRNATEILFKLNNNDEENNNERNVIIIPAQNFDDEEVK